MLSGKLNRVPTLAASVDEGDFLIRSFGAADRSEVLHLYYHGLLAGQVNQSDPASDLVDIEAAYFRRPQDHLWVAEARSSVIGTVAISEDDAHVTHLRRLRVAPFWQLDSRVAIGLIRTAINHARFHGCVKLVFHTSLDGKRAVELLERLGFQFARIRDVAGQHLIEFYDNLYANPVCGNAGGTRSDNSL
jgi:ribosomal protein S18 acetylase RimI-like enzyme